MYVKSFILIAFLIAATAAVPMVFDEYDKYYHEDNLFAAPVQSSVYPEAIPRVLVRRARSPGRGSLDIGYNQDRFGKTASVQYNQNLYRSNDGRLTVDAYARGSRNFDYNRNNYGGGITGSYRF